MIDITELSSLNLIPWDMKDAQQFDISLITSIESVFDGTKFLISEFRYMADIVYDVYGDGIDTEYDWNKLQSDVLELDILYHEPPVVFYQFDHEIPVEERPPTKVYFNTNLDASKLIRGPVGIRVDCTTNPPTFTRLGAAVGKTFEDFYNILPFAARRRCKLSDNGIPYAYDGDPEYNDSDKFGQYMTELSMFYYKRVIIQETNGSMDIWEDWVSYDPEDGFSVYPLFINRDINRVIQRVYVATHECCLWDESANQYIGPVYNESQIDIDLNTDKLSSMPDCDVLCNVALPYYRKLAQNRGKGWDIIDLTYIYMEQMLSLIACGEFDIHPSMGRGVYGYSNYENYRKTGETSSWGIYNYKDTVNPVSLNFFGVENYCGNLWKVVRNIRTGTNRCDIYGEPIQVDIETVGKYVGRYSSDRNMDFGYIRSNSDLDGIHDMCVDYQPYCSGNDMYRCKQIAFGGSSMHTMKAGIFTTIIGFPGTSYASPDACTRLMYTPNV